MSKVLPLTLRMLLAVVGVGASSQVPRLDNPALRGIHVRLSPDILHLDLHAVLGEDEVLAHLLAGLRLDLDHRHPYLVTDPACDAQEDERDEQG